MYLFKALKNICKNKRWKSLCVLTLTFITICLIFIGLLSLFKAADISRVLSVPVVVFLYTFIFSSNLGEKLYVKLFQLEGLPRISRFEEDYMEYATPEENDFSFNLPPKAVFIINGKFGDYPQIIGRGVVGCPVGFNCLAYPRFIEHLRLICIKIHSDYGLSAIVVFAMMSPFLCLVSLLNVLYNVGNAIFMFLIERFFSNLGVKIIYSIASIYLSWMAGVVEGVYRLYNFIHENIDASNDNPFTIREALGDEEYIIEDEIEEARALHDFTKEQIVSYQSSQNIHLDTNQQNIYYLGKSPVEKYKRQANTKFAYKIVSFFLAVLGVLFGTKLSMGLAIPRSTVNIVMLILFATSFLLVYLAKKLENEIGITFSGILGEKDVEFMLRNISPCELMLNAQIRIGSGQSETDAIIIKGNKITIVETKNYSGYISGDMADKNLSHKTTSRSGRVYDKDPVYNPIHQVRTHMYRLKELFNESDCDNYYIQACVMFSGSAEVNITGESEIPYFTDVGDLIQYCDNGEERGDQDFCLAQVIVNHNNMLKEKGLLK